MGIRLNKVMHWGVAQSPSLSQRWPKWKVSGGEESYPDALEGLTVSGDRRPGLGRVWGVGVRHQPLGSLSDTSFLTSLL